MPVEKKWIDIEDQDGTSRTISVDRGLEIIPKHQWQKEIYVHINELIKKTIKMNVFPFSRRKVFPENMNVISGVQISDLNKVLLELKAAEIGARGTRWIFAADAALLGLELKDKSHQIAEVKEKASKEAAGKKLEGAAYAAYVKNALEDVRKADYNSDPVTFMSNVPNNIPENMRNLSNQSNVRNEGICLDAQNVYLLDQFTKESIERVFKNQLWTEKRINALGTQKARENTGIIIRNFKKNYVEYQTGLNRSYLRSVKAKNIEDNTRNVLTEDTLNRLQDYVRTVEKFEAENKTVLVDPSKNKDKYLNSHAFYNDMAKYHEALRELELREKIRNARPGDKNPVFEYTNEISMNYYKGLSLEERELADVLRAQTILQNTSLKAWDKDEIDKEGIERAILQKIEKGEREAGNFITKSFQFIDRMMHPLMSVKLIYEAKDIRKHNVQYQPAVAYNQSKNLARQLLSTKAAAKLQNMDERDLNREQGRSL